MQRSNLFKAPVHDFEQRVYESAKILPPRCSRVLLYLFEVGRATTGQLAHECQCGNVSDAVLKMDAVLKSRRLNVLHYLPVTLVRNKFGDVSLVHYWELVDLHG